MPRVPYDVHVERIGNVAAVRWIDEQIDALRALALKRPPPAVDETQADNVRRWQRKWLLSYGKLLGSLSALAQFGVIPPEFAQRLNLKLRGMMNGNNAPPVSGARMING